MSETIGLMKEGHIARIEFRRPDHHNAFNAEMHRDFALALGEARQMADLRVLILQAQGRTFLGGGDFEYLRQLRDQPDLRRRSHQEAYDAFTLLNDMPVPVVAAMHGHALGFGATIVTSCDIIVAWKDAMLGDPHVKAGIVAGDGGVLSWSAAAGATRAKRMLLTGDTVTAQQAYAFGLVTDLADTPEEVPVLTTQIAQRVAALPPMAVQGTKRVFNALEKQRNGSVIDVSLLTELATVVSDDLEEALLAATEKRPGIFHNR
ncbi:MAG: enoyl-CoA hydratase/isomerase family protein [Caulobacter sp.]